MKIFATLPTYNESENIAPLIHEIRGLDLDIRIVVADDDSPDGTWKIVRDIARKDPDVHLIHRTANIGRGYAGAEAFRFALDKGADVVIEMDADFSHHPRHIPAMLDKIGEYDLVLGSRAVPGGEDLRASAVRQWVTRLSSLYTTTVLRLPLKDVNSGFRCFRRSVLEAVNPDTIRSQGPSIVQEVLYKAHVLGFTITEIPIVFSERQAGESNLNFKKLVKGFFMVLKFRGLQLAGKL
jgi:dolichol-phosphate mannosyltransferase